MIIAWLIFEIILIIFSCITLSYVAMASSIGPWISPAIIILSNILISKTNIFSSKKNYFSLLNQASCNLAGLVCTAIGFTLPTLFFLDRDLFQDFLSNPVYFCLLISAFVLIGSMLGSASINVFGKKISKEFDLCPVSRLIVQTDDQSRQNSHGRPILSGFFLSGLICLIRDGLKFGNKVIFGQTKLFFFSIRPTMLAVGYMIGSKIIAPLILGIATKELMIKPLIFYRQNGIFKLFSNIDDMAISAAFCGGMILFEVLNSLFQTVSRENIQILLNRFFKQEESLFPRIKNLFKSRLLPATFLAIVTLTFFGFSPIQAIFLSIGSIISSVEISRFLLGYGLAPFGRFATFLMFPAIAIFTLDSLHITLLCIFVSISCAAAANLTIQNGIAKIKNIDATELKAHHWLGILICSVFVGIIFWILCTNLNIGTSELFAQRGRMRAIMVTTPSFNRLFMLFGGLFGLLMKKLNFPITMVFGGLMMPKDLTIGLILGAFFRKILTKTQKTENFWTGVFVGESIVITVSLIIRLFGSFITQ